MQPLQWKMKTPIGPVHLVASAKGLQGLFPEAQAVPMAPSLRGSAPETKILAQAARQLEEYFEGKRHTFELTFDIQGTDFQKKVWRQLTKIPYGKTCSYSDIAESIHNKKAVRAVGSANGKNPLFIVVPCHRVIAADGSLGGYSAGLPAKIKLLELEKRVLAGSPVR